MPVRATYFKDGGFLQQLHNMLLLLIYRFHGGIVGDPIFEEEQRALLLRR